MERQDSFLKSLKTIHLALLVGQCLLLAVITFLVIQKKSATITPALDKILQLAALLVAVAGTFVVTRLFRNRLAAINENALTVEEKAAQYRAASIFQWSVSEFAVLFILICFFLTVNYSFAALAAFLIVYFALLMPSKLRVMLHLQLSEQDAAVLE